jgi:hypothetical protein
MQNEITTAEAAELFDVTRKTIALWAQQGIMVKLRHGVFDLKKSLQNWVGYQRCVFEGQVDPLQIWEIRRDIAYAEAHRQESVDVNNLNLRPLDDLEAFYVELDAAGNVVRARPAST